jgi:uridylate kinase
VNVNAQKIERLSYERVIRDGLRAIDMTAACFCAEHKVKKTILFKLDAPNSIMTAVGGNEDEILKIGSIVECE